MSENSLQIEMEERIEEFLETHFGTHDGEVDGDTYSFICCLFEYASERYHNPEASDDSDIWSDEELEFLDFRIDEQGFHSLY